MKAARLRLDRLALLFAPPVGCPTCRHWGAVYVVGDGWVSRPEVCPVCGRRVPHGEPRVYAGVDCRAV